MKREDEERRHDENSPGSLNRRQLLHLTGMATLAAGLPKIALGSAQAASSVAGATLKYFDTPANINDFPADPAMQLAMRDLWTGVIDAFTEIARNGDPWSVSNDHDRDGYFNPLRQIPKGTDAGVVPILWTAFPNRLLRYFAASERSPYQLSQSQLYQLVDQGYLSDVPAFDLGLPAIPTDHCPFLNWQQPRNQWQGYGEATGVGGPRGWQDEYCEISVRRDPAGSDAAVGKITRIMFTCENPEYWFALWQLSPERVVEIYNEVIFPGDPAQPIKLDDLVMKDQQQKPVHDPATGLPIYNPLNKWNRGTVSAPDHGGAMHLTSPPNAIAAEIYLAGAATLLREPRALAGEEWTEASMICCAKYGGMFRNSDPNIGFSVNQLVRNLGLVGTLRNPAGLYIQTPDFSNYTTPDGTDAAEFWKIVRGRSASEANANYDQILHVNFEVPADKNYTVSDIRIGGTYRIDEQGQKVQNSDGSPILFASQIMETIHVALAVHGIAPQPATKPQYLPCPAPRENPNPWGQAILGAEAWRAYEDATPYMPYVQNPYRVTPGSTVKNLALVAVSGVEGAAIVADDPGIQITVTGFAESTGKRSNRGGVQQTPVFYIDISVADTVKPGLKSINLNNPGVPKQRSSIGLLEVVAKQERNR